MRRSQWLLALALFSFVGCAHLDIHKTIDQDNPKEYGLRFYRPRPYLLVTLSDKGCTPSIIQLPDYSQEYILHPYYWLGSLTFKPTLTDGWNLTAFDSTVDTKIPDTINSLVGLMKTAAEIAKGARPGAGTPADIAPGLYSMTFSKETGLLTEFKVIMQFKDENNNPIACPKYYPPKQK